MVNYLGIKRWPYKRALVYVQYVVACESHLLTAWLDWTTRCRAGNGEMGCQMRTIYDLGANVRGKQTMQTSS